MSPGWKVISGQSSRARGPGETGQPRNHEKIWYGGGPARQGGLPARCPPLAVHPARISSRGAAGSILPGHAPGNFDR